ncbi:MAG: hypothetical protein ACO3C1_11715, partial [Ilumatobacteraceae bacterium]
LRIARLGGCFDRWCSPDAAEAMDLVSRALGITTSVELPEVERARSAVPVGERSIRRLLPSLGVALVAVDGAELRNVNTPADLAD